MRSAQFEVHAATEEHHWWFLARRQILTTLLHHLLPPSKDTHLIDVGCGTGGMTEYFSREYSCMGIDPSKDGIDFARTRFPSCTYVCGQAPQDIREDLQKADCVLLLEVLEHVKDDRGFVQELIAAMKPGAILVIAAPADMSLWSPHDDGFEHERRYEESSFRRTWQGANMEELLVSHCNARLYPLAKLMRSLSTLRGKAWGPGDTDIALPSKYVNTLMQMIFAGERHRLLSVLKSHAKPYKHGVTLLAILRKH